MTDALSSIIWAPFLPPWLLAALAGLCLFPGLYGALRGRRDVLWRVGAILLGLLWLANPRQIHPHMQTQPQDALLVVDVSPSMDIGQRKALVQQARAQLLHQGRALHDLTIHELEVSGGHGQGTRLFDAMDHAALSLNNPAGIFLLTDGMDHDIPDQLPPSLKDMTGRIIPLHLLLSARGEETDRRLRVLSAPPYVIIGQTAHIRVQVDDLGTPGGQPVDILDHGPDGQTNILAHTKSGQPVELDVPVTHAGLTLKELTASPLPGEASLRNNSTIIQLQGVRDRLRVLLVSGVPNQGARVWRTLLKADPSVDLVHFTILRSPDTEDDTPLSDLALIPFPTHELFAQKINSFDLIILDGFRNQNILPESYLENIARYVRKGGGLLVVGGPEMTQPGTLQDTPVGAILPAHVPSEQGIMTQPFSPRRTALGLSHPVTQALPEQGPWGKEWGPWYRALRTDQTQGRTLLATPSGAPLLVLDQKGQGRVAMLLSDQIWLWSRGEKGGGPQAELLRRLSHWLMKEPELEENQLDAHIEQGQLHVSRTSLAPLANVQADIIDPDGHHAILPLSPGPGRDGIWTGSLPLPSRPEQNGRIWTVQQGGLSTTVALPETNPLEDQDLRSTATRMASLVSRSGGGLFWLGTGTIPEIRQVAEGHPLHGTGWAGLPLHQSALAAGGSSTAFLPGWLALIPILAMMGLGWWREGR
ncbi:VWA domain-containing protein [Bombella sp. ESL0387]|nr:VWA domain-containing protein [Bombella sp. ESL0387]